MTVLIPIVLSAWIQLGPGGSQVARAIINGGECPAAQMDSGSSVAMNSRFSPSPDFPVGVCELSIPGNSTKTVKIGKFSLKTWSGSANRIVVLGDTGCKIKKKKKQFDIQACNDPSKWPLNQVAKSIAAWNPDLIIHVGDYHYREAPCPAGHPECQGAHSGDDWASWNEDFFTPATDALTSAPWVIVRGNHELCSRGGNGWFRLLSPGSSVTTCTDDTDTYDVDLGGVKLAVIDSADDQNIQPSLEKIKPDPSRFLWTVTHRPFLTPGADDETNQTVVLPDSLKTPGALNLSLSGHAHLFSVNTFKDASISPEIISGNGSTTLKSTTFGDWSLSDFGFLTLTRISADTWDLVEHDRTGSNVIHCSFTQKKDLKSSLKCDP